MGLFHPLPLKGGLLTANINIKITIEVFYVSSPPSDEKVDLLHENGFFVNAVRSKIKFRLANLCLLFN